MTTQAYILRCLSPLHAGSGDSNYDVIDNKVQRDPHTQFPTIFSSSLKGALREYFDGLVAGEEVKPKYITDIFGAEIKKGKDAADTTQAGKLVFDQSFLLSLPVRSDVTPYLSVSTPELLHDFAERLELFGVEGAEIVKTLLSTFTHYATGDSALTTSLLIHPTLQAGATLEEMDFRASHHDFSQFKKVESLTGSPFALMPHEKFREISLPVVARNQLDNGESKNLWYEELVPREARFFTTVTGPQDLLSTFHQQVNGKVIQVGANASIGYGRLKFQALGELLK